MGSQTRSSAAQGGNLVSQMLGAVAGRVSFAARRKKQQRPTSLVTRAAATVVMLVLNAANSQTRSSAAQEGNLVSQMLVAVAGRVSSATLPLWFKRSFQHRHCGLKDLFLVCQ